MDLQLQALAGGLRRHFQHVQNTRMHDVPILNPALSVEPVGFRRTPQGCLGILITPWFINLMLLPCEGDDWHDLPVGSYQTHVFASGPYDFVIGHEEGIGRFQSCSLLSPVGEIADQETAVAFALAALEAIDDAECRDTESSTFADEIVKRWHGEEQTGNDDTVEDVAATAQPTKLSRRDFLRGRLHKDGEESP